MRWKMRAGGLFVALIALASSGCDGGDDGGGGSGGDVTGGTCDAAKLPATWLGTSYSVRVADDFTFEAAGAPNLATIQVTGTMAIDDCTARFTDTGGVYACPKEQVGTYTFSVSDTALRFTLVSDDCAGRQAVGKGALTRE